MPALAHFSDYDRRHIVYHLAVSGRWSDLLTLLTWEAPEGTNAWFDLKEFNAEIPGYLLDVETATREVVACRDNAGTDFAGRLVSLSLMAASAQSRTAQLGPALMRVLVANGDWPVERAWTVVRSMSDLQRRATYAASLVQQVPDSVIEAAFDQWRDESAPSDPEYPGWSDLLVALAPRLTTRQLTNAIATAAQRLSKERLVTTFVRLAPHVTPPLVWDMTSRIAESVSSSSQLGRFLHSAAAHLPAARREDALSLLFSMECFAEDVDQGLAGLAPHLPADLVRAAFKMWRGFKLHSRLDAGLCALAERAMQLRLGAVLRGIRRAGGSKVREHAMVALAELEAMEGRYEDAAALLETEIAHREVLPRAFSRLAARLPASFQERLADAARQLSLLEHRLQALVAIAIAHRTPASLSLLGESRALADELLARHAFFYSADGHRTQAGPARATALTSVALGFLRVRDYAAASEAIRAAVTALRHLGAGEGPEQAAAILADAVAVYASEAPTSDLSALLGEFKHLRVSDAARGRVFSALAPHLSEEQVSTAKDMARSVEEMAALAPVLSHGQLGDVLSTYLPRLYPEFHAVLVDALALYLSPPQMTQALRLSRSIGDTLGRAVAIASHARYCENGQRDRWQLAAVDAIETEVLDERSRAQALYDVAVDLGPAAVRRAIGMSEAMHYDFNAVRALGALLPQLARHDLSEEPLASIERCHAAYGAGLDLAGVVEPMLDRLVAAVPRSLPWLGPAGVRQLLNLLVNRGPIDEPILSHVYEYAVSGDHDESDELDLLAALLRSTRPPMRPAILARVRRLSYENRAGAAEALWQAAASDELIEAEALNLTLAAITHGAIEDDINETATAAASAVAFGGIQATRRVLDAVASTLQTEESGARFAEIVLDRIGPLLPVDCADEAWEVALKLGPEGRTIGGVIVALSKNSPERALSLLPFVPAYSLPEMIPKLCAIRPDWTERLLDQVVLMEDEWRAQALVAIAPYVTPQLVRRAIRDTMAIGDKFHRRAPLLAFTVTLCLLPRKQVRDELIDLVQAGAARETPRSRLDVLYDLGSLGRVTHHIEGAAGCEAVCGAVTQVCRWWR